MLRDSFLPVAPMGWSRALSLRVVSGRCSGSAPSCCHALSHQTPSRFHRSSLSTDACFIWRVGFPIARPLWWNVGFFLFYFVVVVVVVIVLFCFLPWILKIDFLFIKNIKSIHLSLPHLETILRQSVINLKGTSVVQRKHQESLWPWRQALEK